MSRRGAAINNRHNAGMMPIHNPVMAAANRVLSREAQYRQNVKAIQASAALLADKLRIHGEVEAALTCSTAPHAAEESTILLQEQRTLLKEIAAANVGRDRDISCFLGAVREMNQEAAVAANAADDEEKKDDDEVPNYESILTKKMEALANQHAAVEVDVHNEDYCKEIRTRLGEKEKKARTSKKSGRRSSTGDGTDDEDELEILGATSQASEEHTVKCPITGMFYENPLKSKVCGHTYSSAGVQQLFKNRKYNCPVAGCRNSHLKPDQLEEDVEMEIRVQRFKRRTAQAEQQRRRRIAEEEEDEGEFEEEDDVKMTVIS